MAERGAASSRRRSGRVLVAASAILGVAGLVLAALVVFAPKPAGHLVDLDGNAVALDGGAAVAPEVPLPTDGPASGRFRVPSVGLDVPLGALRAVGDVIEPPDFVRAFLVADRGARPDAPESGTVFVVMHSLRGGGRAPGNLLMDPSSSAARVAPGVLIEVAGTRYTVTGSRLVDKPQLASDADVWRNAPGRLVVITCQQLVSGKRSVQNLVITGQLEQ